jgi:hypothetical protein
MEDKLKILLSLAFPSMVPMAPKKGIDWMQEPYYSSGIAAESHPVASVVGPLKGANMLRKWLLKGIKPKPDPTSAISAISLADQEDDSPEFGERIAEWLSSDEENEQILLDHGINPDRLYSITNRQRPIDPPDLPRLTGPPDRLRLEGPPNFPRLTYNPDPVGDDYWQTGDEGPIENYTDAEMLQMGFTQAEIDRLEPEYTEDELIQLGDDDGDFDEPDWDADIAVNFDAAGNRYPNDGSLVSDKEFYTQPKGYYSALSKIIAGDTLTKAEKESAIREIKYSNLSYDRKHFDLNDAYKGLDLETEVDEYGNILPSAVPSLTDPEAIKKFKEKRPLEFTVRQSEDYVGGKEGTKASHLYIGGGNKKGAQHFFEGGRPAQAFITHNVNGGTFNVEESQDERRPDGSTLPYSNQVITKLAQQTVLDWADSGVSTITIPKGEPIFDKYYSTLGKGLWGDEKSLLKVKGDKEFAEKAFAFYNQPLIQKEAKKDVLKHIELLATTESFETAPGLNDVHFDLNQRFGKEYVEAISDLALGTRRFGEAEANLQNAIDILTLQRADKLKGLRSNYQGKVRHYNEYTKQVKKALKQHGANLFDEESDKETRLKITNPEETIRRTKKDGFTMAMLLKRIADRQVA